MDNEKVKRETASYKKLPQIIDFRDEDGNDRMQEEIQANYNRVKQEVQQIVTDEMERIRTKIYTPIFQLITGKLGYF